MYNILVYIIQLSEVSEYSEYCKSKCFWGLNFFCNIFQQYLNHFLYIILIWFLCVSLMVMFETVNKISTKPFQSIGSHKKFYSHWKHLSGVQSLLKNFDLFNSWTKSHWFQTCSIYFLMLKENSWLKHVHVCIWMHSHQKI